MSLPTYAHSKTGRRYWVKVHPDDDLWGLPSVYLTNPDEFVPKINRVTGNYEAWGINDEDADTESPDEMNSMMPSVLLRTMKIQHLYLGKDIPQVQFIRHLKKKEAQIAARDKGERAQCDYLLRIVMPKLLDNEGKDLIWRQFRVSGAIKLNALQDKIIQPTMGWERNYHGYLYTDRSDGAMFGPKDSQHIDMMHLGLNGYDYIPDEKYTLADILDKEGSTLGYRYDLGDQWLHEIIVEKIYPPSESNGRFELIAGSGACPGEDMHGNHGWLETLEKLAANPRDIEVHREIRRSMNYKNNPTVHKSGWIYNPTHFDIGAARRRVFKALRSTASVPQGAKKFIWSFDGQRPDLLNPTLKKDDPDMQEIVKKMKDGSFMMQGVKEGKDPKEFALCEGCGKPDGLKRCARCQKVWYCSRDCQANRWKVHKLKCEPAPEAGCENCGKPEDLKRCARCQKVWYCSRECQSSRWKEHKSECQPPMAQESSTAAPPGSAGDQKSTSS